MHFGFARPNAKLPELEDAAAEARKAEASKPDPDEAAYVEAADSGGGLGPGVVLENGRGMCNQVKQYAPGEERARYIIEASSTVGENEVRYLCKDVAKDFALSQRGFYDGTYSAVSGSPGEFAEVRSGSYRTGKPVTDCYWERSASNGRTIANDFVGNAPGGITVTIRAGEGFTSQGCGTWLPTGR